MDKATVRAIINAAGKNPIRVTMDNEHFFTTQLNGCRIDFNDDKEILTVIMANDDPNTMLECPYNIFVTEYEHIQTMSIRVRAKDVVNVIDGVGFIKDPQVMKDFVKSGVIGPVYGYTTSTQDVTERDGAKPTIFSTDQYGSAGENRAERRNKLIPHGSIPVNPDGSIDLPSGETVPIINREVDRTGHSEVFTPEDFTPKTE